MENLQTIQEAPVNTPKKPLSAGVVYGIFGFVLLLILIILLIPLPFSDYLYNFESRAFEWISNSSILIVAGATLLGYLTYYLLRIFRITAVRPVTQGTVPIVERTIFGPLTLWALMYICAEIVIRVLLRSDGEPNVAAAFTAAALVSSFPIAFLAHGLISFSLAKTRKRYAIMFFSSVLVIALMPLLLQVTAPLADAAQNIQQSQDRAKTDKQLSQASSMKDCANVGGDFGWIECISTYMKSKVDYLECLNQAPSKKRPIDDEGVEYLCDREVEQYYKLASGTVKLVNGDLTTIPSTERPVPTTTISIEECRDITRYRAWAACVSYTIATLEDYKNCLSQSAGRTGDHGEIGAELCNNKYPGGFTDYQACVNVVPAKQKDSCLPLIMSKLTAQSDVSWCYKLPLKDPSGQYESQASTCIKNLIKLQGRNHYSIVNICGYVSRQPLVGSINGVPCSQDVIDEYNLLKGITSVEQCYKQIPLSQYTKSGDCIIKTVQSKEAYATCINLAKSQTHTTSQSNYIDLCNGAWPSGS